MRTLARERDKAEILRRLRTLEPKSARRWERMSAHQMVCHLIDTFSMALGTKQVSPAAGLRARTIVKWLALYVPVAWPPGVQTLPELDQERSGRPPAVFAADIAELEALIELISSKRDRFDCPAHPIFGSMSEVAWLRWGYVHSDHHLRQFGV